MNRSTAAALIGAGAALLLAQPPRLPRPHRSTRSTQEGLSADQSARLAEAFRIPDALQANGAFGYVGESFAQVPLRQVGDRQGRVRPHDHVAGARHPRARPAQAAQRRRGAPSRPASWSTSSASAPDFDADPDREPRQAHAHRPRRPRHQPARARHHRLPRPLARRPARHRPGRQAPHHVRPRRQRHPAEQRAAPARPERRGPDHPRRRGPQGLRQPLRRGRPPGRADPRLPPARARRRRGDLPELHLQPRRARRARRPTCRSRPSRASARRPTSRACAAATCISGHAEIGGGSGPYTLKWSSSTTALESNEGEDIAYERNPRGKVAGEELTLEVTDVNGLSATATVALPTDGEAQADSDPGGGGFGKLAIGPIDVGIEQTVDEWQCAQDSAIGFKSVMASKGIPPPSTGAAGAPGSVTSRTSPGRHRHTSTSTTSTPSGTPATARRTASRSRARSATRTSRRPTRAGATATSSGCSSSPARCCVTRTARTTTSAAGAGPSTACTCSTASTPTRTASAAARAARSPHTCSRARSSSGPSRPRPSATRGRSMAIDKEPSGVVYRSMGNIAPGGVTNIGDFFWGQGPTGPDISVAGRTGQWSITGTV